MESPRHQSSETDRRYDDSSKHHTEISPRVTLDLADIDFDFAQVVLNVLDMSF
jgi:hypothetical protein